MPLFEFRCGSCQEKTEQLVLAGDETSRPVCSSCGSTDLTRLLSTFSARSGHGGKTPSFEPSTACGGGACRMPDVCGADAGDFDLN